MGTCKAFKMTVKVRAIFGPPLRVVKPHFFHQDSNIMTWALL